jgi:hypothetical protein
MNTYSKSEQVVTSSNEQVVTEEAKVSYEAPVVTVMGKVEQLTALGGFGPVDPLAQHQLLL